MEEKPEVDSSPFIKPRLSRVSNKREDSSAFQSRFFSNYAYDRIINIDEFQVFKEKFIELNTRIKSDGTLMTLGCSISELFHYGPAFPQFFSLLIYNIVGHLLFTIIFGIPAFIMNLQASANCSIQDCGNLTSFEKIGIYAAEILAEKSGSTGHPFKLEAHLYFIYSMFSILFSYFVFYRLRKLVVVCMQDVSTPSDYAILVDGFPEPVLEPIVEEFFKENFQDIKIESVITIPTFFNTQPGSRSGGQSFGTCVVIFNTHADQLSVLKQFRVDRTAIAQRCLDNPKYEGHKIAVRRAPDPQDLLVDNFGLPTREIITRNVVYFGVIIGIVALCLLLQIFLCQFSEIPYVWISLMAVLSNKMIVYFCKITVKRTKPTTNTGLAARFAWAAGISQFINLAFTPIANFFIDSNPDPDIVQVYRGLTINIIFQCLVPTAFVFVNISYLLRLNERKEIENEIETDEFTLSSLRKAFLNPEFHIEEFYSVIMSVSLLVALLGAQNPIIFPFVVVAMTAYYWVLKRHFIYYTLTPIKFSAALVESAGNFLLLVPMFSLIGFRLFLAKFAQPVTLIKEVEAVNMWAIIALPFLMLLGHIFLRYKTNIASETKRQLKELTFNEAREKFQENFKIDYEVVINSFLDFRLEITSFS